MPLKSAVDACLKLSPRGKCVNGLNGPIGTWDVSRVTDMSRMFARAKFFSSDLSKWDVSRVKNMRGMFLGATSFNGDVSKWDVSSVNDMNGMFLGATHFKRQLCGTAWVHSKADKNSMFEGSSGSISSTECTATPTPEDMEAILVSEAIEATPVPGSVVVTSIDGVFAPTERWRLSVAVDDYLAVSPNGEDNSTFTTYGPISSWDTSRVTDMNNLFKGFKFFNGDISKWDVSRVTDMSHMFSTGASFNCDISKWDVSSVTDMSHMFSCPRSSTYSKFNIDISNWDVSKVNNMAGMFTGAARFNVDISKWDVSSVTNMFGTFCSAEAFNVDLSKWDVSRVTEMHAMFLGATSFKQELCTDAWVNSKASKTLMFDGTEGSIPSNECTATTLPGNINDPEEPKMKIVFTPESGEELKVEVDKHLKEECKNVYK